MDTKLTLKLNAAVIDKAKAYAKSNGTSLSKIIENYLSSLSKPKNKKGKQDDEIEISPLVKSLTGIIPNLSDDKDHKKEYYEYIAKKHS